MFKVVLLEAEDVVHALETVRRYLYPDTPSEDQRVQRVLMEEVTLLLNLHFGIWPEEFDDDYLDICDYFDECTLHFDNLVKTRQWRVLTSIPSFKRFEVRDPQGLIAIHLNQPIGDSHGFHLRLPDVRQHDFFRGLPGSNYRRAV